MTEKRFEPDNLSLTHIYAWLEESEIQVGFLDAAGDLYKLQGTTGTRVGFVTDQDQVMRQMAHDVRELGTYSSHGQVTSHGLFEGGPIGWVDDGGTVVRSGLIFGEEEVGRVEGPNQIAAGAALLLLFLPEADEDRRNREKQF